MIRRFFKEWLFNVLAWILITNLYALAILTNMKVLFKMAKIEDVIESNYLASYFVSNYQLFEATLFGLFFGTLFFFSNYLIDRIFSQKMPFGKVILLKTISYFFAMVLVFFTMGAILQLMYFYPIDVSKVIHENEEMRNPVIWLSFLTFMLFTAVLINFLIQMSYKIGPKTVFPLYLGKYHTPKSEDRIILFLDLKDSTGIAEELGHMKYSRLIQDCYHDLNKIVFRLNAEVYQYVGDEVVLTWKNKKSNLSKYAVRATFEFKKMLTKRSKYYLDKYGLLPEFKGGLNVGNVSVAEIGEVKRDIAYHGDVVNTASRLQEAAKEYNKTLMVSEKVIDELTNYDGLHVEEMPTIQLKGKKRVVKIFGIEESVDVKAENLSAV